MLTALLWTAAAFLTVTGLAALVIPALAAAPLLVLGIFLTVRLLEIL